MIPGIEPSSIYGSRPFSGIGLANKFLTIGINNYDTRYICMYRIHIQLTYYYKNSYNNILSLPKGLEPSASRLEVLRTIQLCYGSTPDHFISYNLHI